MKKNWLYYISPASILAAISFILLIAAFVELKEERYFFIFFSALVFGVAILILTAIAYAVRFATNGKILYIWLIEAAIIAIPVIGFLMYRQGY